MPGKSNSTDLLSVARSVLREELISELPAAKKYEALMVANAMAISSREMALGSIDMPSSDYLKGLAGVVSDDVDPEGNVIRKLRTGAFNADKEKGKELHSLLVDEAKRKVKISNPRYLSKGD